MPAHTRANTVPFLLRYLPAFDIIRRAGGGESGL
jgi:hypothetical protein